MEKRSKLLPNSAPKGQMYANKFICFSAKKRGPPVRMETLTLKHKLV